MLDENTIEVTPEDVPEVMALRKFEGQPCSISTPRPFDQNVPKLIIKAGED